MKINKIVYKIIFYSLICSFVICHLSFPAGAQATASDPSNLSVGARVLGMGKTFIGLSDDVSSIYTNPAGLANISNWELSSMSGTFMEDYSYKNLGLGYATKYGVFGFGFTTSSIAGGYATKIKSGSDPSNPVYEIDTSQPTINYFNNVAVLSYANKLENTPLPYKLPFQALFGANLKLFMSGLSGDGITKGNASGKDLDLGILLKPMPWLSFGSTLQNILPASFGGELKYESGHTEYFPAVWKNGFSFNILGEKNSLKTIGQNQLNLLLDFDLYPTRASNPTLLHTGVEWIPVNYVSLRAGIDQDSAGNGSGTGLSAVSNMTFGIGLNLNDFKFDYAYHQFTGAPGVTNSFFSISYCPQIKTVVPKVPVITTIATPEVKTIQKQQPKQKVIQKKKGRTKKT